MFTVIHYIITTAFFFFFFCIVQDDMMSHEHHNLISIHSHLSHLTLPTLNITFGRRKLFHTCQASMVFCHRRYNVFLPRWLAIGISLVKVREESLTMLLGLRAVTIDSRSAGVPEISVCVTMDTQDIKCDITATFSQKSVGFFKRKAKFLCPLSAPAQYLL